MATFSDTFQRANGGLGANWLTLQGSPLIVGGVVTTAGGGATRTTVINEPGAHDASITFLNTTTSDKAQAPFVKGSESGVAFYTCSLIGSDGAYHAQILRYSGTPITLSDTFGTFSVGANVLYRLTYNAGNIYFYVDGVLRSWAQDTMHDANNRVGIRMSVSNTGITSFTTVQGPDVRFSVVPDATVTNGPPILLQLSGSGTTWTPGTPGSPTFTASSGNLSGQNVVSASNATAWFAPPSVNTTVTITDPSTALTDTIYVNATGSSGGTGGFLAKLTDNGAAIINRAGTTPPTDGVRVWTNQDVVTTSPILMNQNDALRYIVQYIWFLAGGPAPDGGVNASALLMEWVSGGYTRGPFIDTAPSNTSLKQDLAAALSSLGDLGVQLTGAVDLLGGDSPILSHRDLKIAIDGIQTGGDNSAVLDALAAIRGDTTTSLYTLLSSLAGIRTVHSYNLQDILDAIHLLPTSLDGGYTTADRLANAAGFVGVLAAIAALATVEAEDAAASSGSLAGILALATELAGGVASILAMLESLKSLLGGGANEYRPPVWPGEAHVEWGTAIAIESNEPVIGEMHGVVVDITGCEKGTRLFGYDGITCYSHVGAIGFCSDRGDMEPFQALGPTKGIYTVKTMASAFACRLFRGRNVKGTIRPWKIKAG